VAREEVCVPSDVPPAPNASMVHTELPRRDTPPNVISVTAGPRTRR
jgi:hypothetical protein